MKRIAVITGESGGLGKEFVRQIINEVDEVWAIGRNVAKLEAMKSEYATFAGCSATAHPLFQSASGPIL